MAEEETPPTPPADPPPTPTPAPTPTPSVTPAPSGDGELKETVNGLVTTVSGLVEAVQTLVENSVPHDKAPTHVPWTHRGSNAR
jgi:hypothetical protein